MTYGTCTSSTPISYVARQDLAFAVYRVAKGVVVAALNGVHTILVGRVERGLEAGGLVQFQQARERIDWIIADDQPFRRPRSQLIVKATFHAYATEWAFYPF